MTLQELCEPLFQYICRLNRSARLGGRHDMGQVRDEVKSILQDLRGRASSEPQLAHQFETIRVILVGFADSMIRNSALPFALDWNDIAFEENELALEERFFDELQVNLSDGSAEATERLAVFYTAMGLGFTGMYVGQPEVLRRFMTQCAKRLKGRVDADSASRISNDAYRANTDSLIKPPASPITGVVIACIGLILVLLAANVYLYWSSARKLDEALSQTTGPGPAVAGDATAGRVQP